MVGSHTANHKHLIARVLSTVVGAKEGGFWVDHDSLCRRLNMAEHARTFRPDAYRFNDTTQEIELYEIEVQSMLSAAKVGLLGDFWEFWDGEGDTDWLPVLFIVDRYGNINRMDLEHALSRTGWAALIT